MQTSSTSVTLTDTIFRYKGIASCLNILTRCLVGNYVNFGVFALYGDTALTDALDVVFRLAMSVPLKDIMVCHYPYSFEKGSFH
jgi:hypothetical protein